MLGRVPFPRASGFDPTKLALSAYWRASYSSAPWAAVATAGVSATTGNLVHNATDPTAGTAVNGKTPARFNGTSTSLVNATDVLTGNVLTEAAGTIFGLINVASAAAATGNTYDDAALLIDGNTDCGITIATSGGFVNASGYVYDGSYEIVTKLVGTGAWALCVLRWNGTTLGLTVNSATEVTHAASTATVMTGTIQVGEGYAGGKYLAADVLELGCAAYRFSDTDIANFKSYCNSTYALSL
jgi:hypothetical protein